MITNIILYYHLQLWCFQALHFLSTLATSLSGSCSFSIETHSKHPQPSWFAPLHGQATCSSVFIACSICIIDALPSSPSIVMRFIFSSAASAASSACPSSAGANHTSPYMPRLCQPMCWTTSPWTDAKSSFGAPKSGHSQSRTPVASHHVVEVENTMGKNGLPGVHWCILPQPVEEPGGLRWWQATHTLSEFLPVANIALVSLLDIQFESFWFLMFLHVLHKYSSGTLCTSSRILASRSKGFFGNIMILIPEAIIRRPVLV